MSEIPIGGRLAHFYEFWSSICKDRQILHDIAGVTIPFVPNRKIRQKVILSQIRMLKEECDFVDRELQRLLSDNCITEIDKPIPGGWTSNIFLVPKKDGGFRLILNLKKLNTFIQYQKFKMESIYDLISMLRPLDWLCSVDIKSAYSHIPFLQFRWRNRFFYYNSLPFGIANGPILFVRVTKGIMNYLRHHLIEILFYIDDTFIKNRSRNILEKNVEKVIEVFKNCGFTINYKKSSLVPSQKIVFLGFEIDSKKFNISLTPRKHRDIHELISKVLSSKKKISIPFLGSLERLKIKNLKIHNQKWNAKICLNKASISELMWWQKAIFLDKMCRKLKKYSP